MYATKGMSDNFAKSVMIFNGTSKKGPVGKTSTIDGLVRVAT